MPNHLMIGSMTLPFRPGGRPFLSFRSIFQNLKLMITPTIEIIAENIASNTVLQGSEYSSATRILYKQVQYCSDMSVLD